MLMNNHGGYIVRRIAVNTNNIGPVLVPQPTTLAAPDASDPSCFSEDDEKRGARELG
jgi:hypothetical protein